MATPHGFTHLADLIGQHAEALSPQVENAARYVLAHPDDAALWSMRELAQTAQLPPVTLVRLAKALGFSGYSELRELCQRGMRERSGSSRYISKARQLQVRGKDRDTSVLMEDLLNAEVDNIRKAFKMNDSHRLTKAIEVLEDAKRVFVLGQRSCYPSSYYFHYVYSLFRNNSLLLQSHSGIAADELRGAADKDVLLVISIAPYATDVVRAVHYARERKMRILAITDSSLSPVARAADHALVVEADTPSFFRSIVSTQALLQSILALLVARGGRETLAAIEGSEKQLARFNVYWSAARRGDKNGRAVQ